jgi:hypothetical protein
VNTGEDPFFRCDCAEDFENLTPQHCVHEKPATAHDDPCTPNPCSDSEAACQADNNAAICICPDETEISTSEDCPVTEPEVLTSCKSDTCVDDANCVLQNNEAMCFCYDENSMMYYTVGYGSDCVIPANALTGSGGGSCSDDTCGRNAKCFDQNTGVECRCKNGSDVAVEHDCLDAYPPVACDDPNPCDTNASCQKLYGETKCTCNDGFTGDGHSCATESYNLRR